MLSKVASQRVRVSFWIDTMVGSGRCGNVDEAAERLHRLAEHRFLADEARAVAPGDERAADLERCLVLDRVINALTPGGLIAERMHAQA
jgi:hypothetical protein